MTEEIKQIKKANKAAVVERWMMMYSDNREDYEGITANQIPNGKWESVIELPIINKTVSGTANSQINAILKASDEAYKLIKDYLKENPETKFFPLSFFRGYEIKEVVCRYSNSRFGGEYVDSYVAVERNAKARKKTNDALNRIMVQRIETIKKAMDRLERINGSIKSTFIEILDESLLDETIDEDAVPESICAHLEKNYGANAYPECVFSYKGHRIIFGYAQKDNITNYLIKREVRRK